MSQRAYSFATRNQLWTSLGYTTVQCEIMGPEGRPPARCGTTFVAIHGKSRTGDSKCYVEDVINVDITVTRRVSKVPEDQQGLNLVDAPLHDADAVTVAKQGLNLTVERIKSVMIQQQYVIMNAANATLNTEAGAATSPFVEPLWWGGADEPREVGGDWFEADSSDPLAGIVSTLHFVDARRLQDVPSAV